MPAAHPLSASVTVELDDLIGEPFIVSRQAPGPEIHDYIVRHIATLDSGAKITEHGVGREALLSMVGLRFGLTLVSGAEAEVRYPGVVFVPIARDAALFRCLVADKT